MSEEAKTLFSDSAGSVPHSMHDALFGEYLPTWQMTDAERSAMIMLLRKIEHRCAIEIGTAQGGSLSALSKFSEKVYSLDIDACQHFSSEFPNAEFITGDSQETLPPLLEQLQAANSPLEFVLIDGNHSRAAVKQDIENVISFRPSRPLYVMLHDSFNPDCRQGMLDAAWGDSPFVHFVEIDFVPGIFHVRQDIFKQMWGGLALAVMWPIERQRALNVTAQQDLLFQTVLQNSNSKPEN